MKSQTDRDAETHVVPTLNHVVGQARAVTVLRTAVDAFYYERSKVGDQQAFPLPLNLFLILIDLQLSSA